MEDFLHKASPRIIALREKEFHPKFGFSAHFPFLKLLLSPPVESARYGSGYVPRVRSVEPETIMVRRLHELGIETALLAMEVMVLKDPIEARKKLTDEKILSYALCLPANLPHHIRDRANVIANKLRTCGQDPPYNIPQLEIMAKARLAKMYFGLKKVMDRNADELNLEIKPTKVVPRTKKKDPSEVYIIGII